MEISREISTDIMQYLIEKKGQSVNDIAEFMSSSPEFVQFVIEKKLRLTSDHINNYLKKADLKFWEFAIEAIPMNHLPNKSRKKILLCKEISDHIDKVKKK